MNIYQAKRLEVDDPTHTLYYFSIMQKAHLLYSHSGKELAIEIGERVEALLLNPIIQRFSQGEYLCKLDASIKGNAIIVGSIQNNDDLMEILSIIDAVKRARAEHITLVAPYIAYSRQNLMQQPFSSIGIEIIAKMLKAIGVQKLITVDIHSLDSLKYFDMEVMHITIENILIHYKNKLPQDCAIVAPDNGCAERLGAEISTIFLSKKRVDNAVSMVLHGDVRDKNCLIIDDIFDSGGTLIKAFEVLKENGAKNVYGYVTHFLGNKAVVPMYTTNSLPLRLATKDFLGVFSLADIIANNL